MRLLTIFRFLFLAVTVFWSFLTWILMSIHTAIPLMVGSLACFCFDWENWHQIVALGQAELGTVFNIKKGALMEGIVQLSVHYVV